MNQLFPLEFSETSLLDFFSFQFSLSRYHSIYQLNGCHFKGEDGNRYLKINRSISQGGDYKRGLTHPWPCGDDNQVRPLPTRSHPIKCGKPTGYAGQPVLMFSQFLKFLDGTIHQVLHVVIILPQIGV